MNDAEEDRILDEYARFLTEEKQRGADVENLTLRVSRTPHEPASGRFEQLCVEVARRPKARQTDLVLRAMKLKRKIQHGEDGPSDGTQLPVEPHLRKY